jgi:hypothetical protein
MDVLASIGVHATVAAVIAIGGGAFNKFFLRERDQGSALDSLDPTFNRAGGGESPA